jgi:hypothetical protein
MQERQARALWGLGDTVVYARELAAACAIQARLAAREPIAYSLSPLAEALFAEEAPETADP